MVEIPRSAPITRMVASDLALARRLLAGEEPAFDEFFADYFPRLYRFACARLGGDEVGAEDVVQATLIKAIDRLGTYRGEAALFTWLCTLCRREIADWFERVGRAREVSLSDDRPETRAVLDAIAALSSDDLERKFQYDASSCSCSLGWKAGSHDLVTLIFPRVLANEPRAGRGP